ncbi:MAG: hypothetical protein K6C10_07390, partial [Prevotella sp.]|nr:hypothetical protein [Prevotella sp.]
AMVPTTYRDPPPSPATFALRAFCFDLGQVLHKPRAAPLRRRQRLSIFDLPRPEWRGVDSKEGEMIIDEKMWRKKKQRPKENGKPSDL